MDSLPTPQEGDTPKKSKRSRNAFLLVLLIGISFAAYWGYRETLTSSVQARVFSDLAGKMTYKVEPGASKSIRFPHDSPYDERLGYAGLPDYIGKLSARDYQVSAQARMSAKMTELVDMGVFATYREKTKTGLTIYDCRAQELFAASYPERIYNKFEQAPPVLVSSLLFIENRELLDNTYPKRNPAVEWDRLGKAVIEKSVSAVAGGHRAAGGSTLATQIEKYRHSPEGRTGSMKDKLQQMVSASLRSYQDGPDTSKVRRRIVLEYLNTVPLSAKPGYGEVNGIGDGMWVWYGRSFDEVNKRLNGKLDQPDAETALVFKEALSLMIAQRRPSYYLGDGAADLEVLANSHLRILANDGAITPAMRDVALQQHLHPATGNGLQLAPPQTFVSRKASNAIRNHLANLLGDNRMYNLDRLDLTVVSTLDAQAQTAVTQVLRDLRDPDKAKAAGLTGKGMLGNGDPANVVYSFTLLEKGEQNNLLRLQTDNFDQPLDINEGAKLDLGSTAKLRTLVTYLDIMDQLHKKYGGMDAAALGQVKVDPQDKLTQWGLDYFKALPMDKRELTPMLNAAMERKYSGNPGEGFFTGGGLHHFGNFSKEDNSKILTVTEALRHSTNLVFVRLMRDVAKYYMFSVPGSSASLLSDADDPRRAGYLARFADKEGKEFLARFYAKYKGKPETELDKILLANIRSTPVRLAVIHRTVYPLATQEQFAAFLKENLPSQNEVPEERVAKLYDQYAIDKWSLADRGYLASVHPLELWMAAYLRLHPGATLSQMTAASEKERQEVYQWLFKTHRKHAQDKRIAGLIEVEGFMEIHKQWKKMGYPFESLVPSYATTLGASADRPAALAEMMGIIVNGGVRKSSQRVTSLHFAKGTPYETLVTKAPPTTNEQAISPEVARVVADAIRGVVSDGTAKRVKSAFVSADGAIIPVGGKTGTGDQRFDVYAAGGRLIESRYVNRSATFVFNIGERFFGSMTAYVHGPASKNYDFTSALPVQLLVVLAPHLMPLIEPHAASKPGATPPAVVMRTGGAAPVAVTPPLQACGG
ncbi:Membrane carboxypeptidase (penicillin-binding protein) [Duganella sacchari]|uniref:peptidoglycan glycosyltransferase n=1 Tax=Duganella sacchari TaxID=551987 RepID=A0A1M7PJV6_9BURK|nr:transglycosylase domain-containing protein [Duganella sacchari]SHN17197.1 Membrane carboxypeptidase (penicillin-binding protein) [Duganella sacchari]